MDSWALLILIVVVLAVVAVRSYRRERRIRAIRLSQVDYMSGREFEAYAARLLQDQGYRNVQITRHSGDYGVDILASMNGTRHAFQVKRSSGRVSRRAVSDAVAGKMHYRAAAAGVITNAHFSTGAQTLARSTGCQLIDRDQLATWILHFQRPTKP